jgi:tryptophanase
MAGKYDENGNLVPATLELVRLAIPRRVYTQSHMDYVIETMQYIMKHRESARGIRITYEPKYLRHFTAHFKPIELEEVR